MADTKISALTAGAALGGTEAIPAVQSAATVKITAAQIKTFVSAAPALVTPDLGTPSAGVLTNATGLPPATGLSTFVAPLKGGLGAALVPVIGDILAADSTTSFARIAAVATGQVLKSNGAGVAPSWSATPAFTATNLTGLPLTTGVTGVLPVANGGTNASAAGIAAFNNITGYSASGATGTTSTNVVFSTSPTLVTPALGVATATSIAIGGATIGSNALALTGTANISGTITAGADVNVAGYVRLADSLAFYWQTRSVIRSPANGNIKLGDSAETSFGLLQFGGVTSSYPAIKRNGAAINFRLADDSADASITAASINASTFLKSGSYTVATVPSAATSGAGARIYVSDEVGGATPAFSDATNWRRYADRAIIS